MNRSRKRILLVENEPIIAAAQARALQELGYNVKTATSGEKAQRLAGGGTFNLILMDINLGSGMDGTEAAEKILRERDIPIIFPGEATRVVQASVG